MKILVVDDELAARSELSFQLQRLVPEAVISEAENGPDAENQMSRCVFDVVFLDINMPGESGLILAEKILSGNEPPLIVFATAYDEYALKAFDLAAVDYVLKPFSDRRLAETVARLKSHHGKNTALSEQRQLIQQLIRGPDESQVLPVFWVVRENGNRLRIDAGDIVFAEADGKYTNLHCADGQVWKSSYMLKELESALESHRFYRIHKSCVLNLEYAQEVIPWFSGRCQVRLSDQKGTELQVSRRQLAGLKKLLGL